MDCGSCKFAEWDYEEYYNTNSKQWFVCGCEKDSVPENCEDYEDNYDG